MSITAVKKNTTFRKLEKYPALEAHSLGSDRWLEFFGTDTAARYRWRVIDYAGPEPVNLASSPSWYPDLDVCRHETRWLRRIQWRRWPLLVAVVANLPIVILAALAIFK